MEKAVNGMSVRSNIRTAVSAEEAGKREEERKRINEKREEQICCESDTRIRHTPHHKQSEFHSSRCSPATLIDAAISHSAPSLSFFSPMLQKERQRNGYRAPFLYSRNASTHRLEERTDRI